MQNQKDEKDGCYDEGLAVVLAGQLKQHAIFWLFVAAVFAGTLLVVECTGSVDEAVFEMLGVEDGISRPRD